MEGKKSNIIDYFSVVVKWRKLIFVNFIVVCIITAIISLIVPKNFFGKFNDSPANQRS